MKGLNLTRRVGESILIGADIVVSVTKIDRHTVRLTIEAPRDVHVVRQEIAHLPQRERHAE